MVALRNTEGGEVAKAMQAGQQYDALRRIPEHFGAAQLEFG